MCICTCWIHNTRLNLCNVDNLYKITESSLSRDSPSGQSLKYKHNLHPHNLPFIHVLNLLPLPQTLLWTLNMSNEEENGSFLFPIFVIIIQYYKEHFCIVYAREPDSIYQGICIVCLSFLFMFRYFWLYYGPSNVFINISKHICI